MKNINQLLTIATLLLCFIIFSCQNSNDNKQQYIGEWDKINSDKYIDRLIFSEKDGKLILKWVEQNVEKYRGIEKEYTCDIDEKGTLSIHAELGEVKGMIVNGRLFCMGNTYERRASK